MKFSIKKKIVSVIFFIVLIIDIYAIIYQNKPLELLFKPLLIVFIVALYLISVFKKNYLYLLALFFSFLGDILLVFENKFFIIGLVSFLLVHIIYIKLTYNFIYKLNIKKYFISLVPFFSFFVIVFFFIYKNLNEMIIPIIIYSFVISSFGALSLINYFNNKKKCDLKLLIGSIFFILSDSLIAINKFYFSSLILSVLIIVFYSISQFLICKAIISKKTLNNF